MGKPVRILFTIPNFITAGSGEWMLSIVERLDRERYSPAVAVLRQGGRLDHEVRQMGIHFLEAAFTVSARPYCTLLFRAWQAAKAFRPYRFNLWHSFHYLDDYTEPIIARLAGVRAWMYTKKNTSWGSRSWYMRTFLATGVAAMNSEMMNNFFKRPRFRRKARLINQGIDTQYYSPRRPEKLRFRERLGIPLDSVIIGIVGNIFPVKGHDILLRALGQVPGVPLIVVGRHEDADYRNSLETVVRDLALGDRVYFLGPVSDIPEFLAEVDIFAFPSRKEGFGAALLEAMSCGKASVSSNIPGPQEVIEHGKSGYLVPTEDPEKLASKLQLLASSADLRRSIGLAARSRIVDSFSIEKEVAAYEAFYNHLSDSKGFWIR